VLIATVKSNGAKVSLEDGNYLLSGEPISPEKLNEYDGLGVLDWVSEDMRSLVLQSGSSELLLPHSNEATLVPPTESDRKSLNGLQVTGFVFAFLCALWAVLYPLVGGDKSIGGLVLSFAANPLAWAALLFVFFGDRRAAARHVGSSNFEKVVWALAIPLALGVGIATLMGSGSIPAAASQPQAQTVAPAIEPSGDPLGGVTAAKDCVFLGSTTAEVVRVLGEPDQVETGDEWWYWVKGEAYVKRYSLVIKNGRLDSYRVDPRGVAALKKMRTTAPALTGEVAVGDSVSTVLGKMGTPTDASLPSIVKGQAMCGAFYYYSNPASMKRVVVKTVYIYNGVVDHIE